MSNNEFNKPIDATAHEVIAAVAELLIQKGIITDTELQNKIMEKQQRK